MDRRVQGRCTGALEPVHQPPIDAFGCIEDDGDDGDAIDDPLNAGKDVAAVLQALEVSEATYLRWRNQYGG